MHFLRFLQIRITEGQLHNRYCMIMTVGDLFVNRFGWFVSCSYSYVSHLGNRSNDYLRCDSVSELIK